MSEAILTASIGFVGVVLGAALAPVVEWARMHFSSRRRARYAAIRLVCVLDAFAGKCVDVAADDGTPDAQGYYSYDPLPDMIRFPDNLDWSVLDQNLVYRILSLPNAIEDAVDAILFASETWVAAPYDDLGAERQYHFSRLGLQAIELARLLRWTYGLPEKPKNGRNFAWSAFSFLSEIKKKTEAVT